MYQSIRSIHNGAAAAHEASPYTYIKCIHSICALIHSGGLEARSALVPVACIVLCGLRCGFEVLGLLVGVWDLGFPV